MGYEIKRKKWDECRQTTGHVVCGNCGHEFHVPCKKYPGHSSQGTCPDCGKSTG
jgi:predicted RNA-binding Zn-ribbon protein involved in translation (DUF1610 family)